jgi:nucleoside-diphosphate-sugar epimerase
MNILITGGAGYLGSIMVPYLLSNGHNVTVLDNFLFSQDSLLDCCNSEHFNIVKGDARDEAIIKPLLKDKDLIIPLAAIVGAPMCKLDKTAAITTNRDAIQLLIKMASINQKIIIPITNSGYGIGEKGVMCTEETQLKPISLYGTTKVEAEKIIMNRGNAISLRLATVFGMSPRMRLDLLVNDFTYRAVKDRSIVVFEGHFKRNFIHVRDVSRAFLHVINNFESMKNQIYNVGLSNANLSKLELCEVIKKQVPDFFVYLEAPIGEDPDKRDYIVSNDKIEKTGYNPHYSIESGIDELIKGYTILSNNKYSNV